MSAERGENKSANASLRPGLLGPDTEAVGSAAELVVKLRDAVQEMANGRPVNGGDLEEIEDLLDMVESDHWRLCYADVEQMAEQASHIASGYKAAIQRAVRTLRDDAHCEACASHKIYPSPATVADDLEDALNASPATPIGGLSLGVEGDQGSSVARADMTPPSGASDGPCKSEGGGS